MDAASPPERTPSSDAGGAVAALPPLLGLAGLWGAAAWLHRAPIPAGRLAPAAALSVLLLAALVVARRTGRRRRRWLRGLAGAALLVGALAALLVTTDAGAAAAALLDDGATAAAALRRVLLALPSALYCLGGGAASAYCIAVLRLLDEPHAPPAQPALPAPDAPPLLPPPPAAPDAPPLLLPAHGELQRAAEQLVALQGELVGALATQAPPAALLRAITDAAARIEATEASHAAELARLAARLGEDGERTRAALAEATTAVQGASRAEVQALADASTQAVRVFTGVSRHLDKTWDKVQESFGALQAALEELRRMRGNLDAMAVKLISAESKGRESAVVLDELGQELEDLRAAVAEQGKGIERFLMLSKADQGALSMNLDRIRKLLERGAAPGPGTGTGRR